jgi:hypothetical protein
MVKRLVPILAVAAAAAFHAHAGVILNFFPVSAFNANTATMDATLGTTGFTVDTFETTTLIPGLTITLSGGVPLTTLTSLPAVFDTSVCGSLSANSQWDGADAVVNIATNSVSNCSTPANIAGQITLNYAPGAASFGVGFGNFQSLSFPTIPITNHELFVNGVDLGVLETLAGANFTPGLARNAYLRIDGTAGTLITSVAVENLTATDVLVLDHVAVQAAPSGAPEPATGGFAMLAILGLGGWKVRRRRVLAGGTPAPRR